MKTLISPELAPCGVWCGACPSFKKSCLGCASEDHKQNRRTKWGCKIRVCAHDKEKVDFSMDCGECGGQIYFYHDTCSQCGLKQQVE